MSAASSERHPPAAPPKPAPPMTLRRLAPPAPQPPPVRVERDAEPCRWPLTEAAPWHFCGAPVLAGAPAPYCAAHLAVAYAPRDTEWDPLPLPKRGRPPAAAVSISGARLAPGKFYLEIIIAESTTARMGWGARQAVLPQIDRATGTLLRLEPNEASEGSRRLAPKNQRGQPRLACRIRATWLNETHEIEAVEHRIDGNALILALPEWARPPAI